MDLDIILPCFNPTDTWEQKVRQAYHKIGQLLPEKRIRLILVNDGSTANFHDDALTYLRREIPCLEIVSYPENRGKGYAVRAGAQQAEAPWVLFTDIDFPYEEEDLVAIYRELCKGQADIVVGTRRKNYYRKAPLHRAAISYILRNMTKVVLGLPISDSQGGLKGFSPKGLEVLKQTEIDRYLFDLELIKRASKDKQLRIVPLEVSLKPGIQFASVGSRILYQEFSNFLKVLRV